MQRTVVKKSGLREAEEALCAGQTVGERLEVLAELNRVGLAALGMADAPLECRVAKKFPFREFRERMEGRRGRKGWKEAKGIEEGQRERVAKL